MLTTNQIIFSVMLSLYTLSALCALVFYRKQRLANIVPNILSGTGALCGIWLSLTQLIGLQPEQVALIRWISSIPNVTVNLSLDKLSAFFLFILSVVNVGAALYSIGYLTHYYNRRNIGLFNFCFNIFNITMIGVITASHMIFFFIAWELMSLFSYFLVVFEADSSENQRAGTIYLIMTHLAAAFLMIAFILIHQFTNSWQIGGSLQDLPPLIKNLLFACFLIGFGTKAGIIPLHIWLPYAHPAAPSNVSALMSGVMIKIAIYGMIRFIMEALGSGFQWWGMVILIIGIITTVLGAAYSFMENNIKRLLAYCSIENIGIILTGFGAACWSYAANYPVLGALALLACLIHIFNHAIIKGILFFGAGAIYNATHTKDMESLGGLVKSMPFLGVFMLVASLAIAAIPPLNGFVGEWLIYQSLFASLEVAPLGLKVVIMLAVAGLAIGSALAAASFIKMFGISFLGLPRSTRAKEAKDPSFTIILSMGLFALLSLGVGIFPGVLVRLLDGVVYNLSGITISGELQGDSFLLYYPLTIGKNSLAPLAVLIGGCFITGMVFLAVKLLGGSTRQRKYITWDCGFTGLTSRMQYTATGFSKPLRIIFRIIYRPSRELKVEEGVSPYFHKAMKYVVTTQPVFEQFLYRPLVKGLVDFAKVVKMKVQTGSVHTYLVYIFVTILILFVYFAAS